MFAYHSLWTSSLPGSSPFSQKFFSSFQLSENCLLLKDNVRRQVSEQFYLKWKLLFIIINYIRNCFLAKMINSETRKYNWPNRTNVKMWAFSVNYFPNNIPWTATDCQSCITWFFVDLRVLMLREIWVSIAVCHWFHYLYFLWLWFL